MEEGGVPLRGTVGACGSEARSLGLGLVQLLRSFAAAAAAAFWC